MSRPRAQRVYLVLEVQDGQVEHLPRLFRSRQAADTAFDRVIEAIEDRGVGAVIDQDETGDRALLARARSHDNEQEVALYALPVAGTAVPRAEPVSNGTGEAVCPEHRRRAKSRKNGGYYCPERLDNGSWCRWEARKGD